MTFASRGSLAGDKEFIMTSQVGEAEVALALLWMAHQQPHGIATFRRLLIEVPTHLHLSPEDHAPAKGNPQRAHWEHVLRSIKLHAGEPGNILGEGYAERIPRIGDRITEAGRTYLEAMNRS